MVRGKSSSVTINYEWDTVVKKFDKVQKKEYVRGTGYHCWLRELECLERLQGHPNFPTLIDYNKEDLTITMEYCGEKYVDDKPRPELVPQVYKIIEALEDNDLKFTTTKFPHNDIHIKNGVLKVIDFENTLPEGSNNLDLFTELFINSQRELFDIQKFENELRKLVEVNDMKTDWNNYQAIGKGNNAQERIANLKLRQYAGKDKTLLDLGANQGEFGVELAKDFYKVYAVEPFVECPFDIPDNMKWVQKTFKDFVESNGVNKFDVVFSFAMTIQVRDEDNMAESDIAKGHYDLTKPGGVMIYETQKLQSRPKNQDHVDKMLEAFRSNYGKEIETGQARQSGKRLYYVFKR
tara:strand:+ start:459 stop:1508 length:1050 start_codon:yes stop_codon:yes gene_type:complete